jgi:hypothetical protein
LPSGNAQGRPAENWDLLAPVYGWLSGALDTFERKEARACSTSSADVRSWARSRDPAPVPGTAAVRRKPAVRAVYVRFPPGFGGFTLSSRHGGQVVWKTVPVKMLWAGGEGMAPSTLLSK